MSSKFIAIVVIFLCSTVTSYTMQKRVVISGNKYSPIKEIKTEMGVSVLDASDKVIVVGGYDKQLAFFDYEGNKLGEMTDERLAHMVAIDIIHSRLLKIRTLDLTKQSGKFFALRFPKSKESFAQKLKKATLTNCKSFITQECCMGMQGTTVSEIGTFRLNEPLKVRFVCKPWDKDVIMFTTEHEQNIVKMFDPATNKTTTLQKHEDSSHRNTILALATTSDGRFCASSTESEFKLFEISTRITVSDEEDPYLCPKHILLPSVMHPQLGSAVSCIRNEFSMTAVGDRLVSKKGYDGTIEIEHLALDIDSDNEPEDTGLESDDEAELAQITTSRKRPQSTLASTVHRQQKKRKSQ